MSMCVGCHRYRGCQLEGNVGSFEVTMLIVHLKFSGHHAQAIYMYIYIYISLLPSELAQG